ncbi:MAG: DUF4214 domain-containing protein [Acidobacteria bacterium]|nr:DUF4214 domain-containing protein [Acidobacteriota bacterium]
MRPTHSRRTDGRPPTSALFVALLALLALSAGLLGLAQRTAHAAGSFTVNSNGDGSDANTADGVCDDGTGKCTFRAAIEQANASPGTDTIGFNIGAGGLQTIVLSKTPPDVTDPAVIDGTTQPGYAGAPLVEILGAVNANPAVTGLRITAGNSTLRGLAIGRMSVSTVLLGGVGGGGHGGNHIESCYLGLRADGVTHAGSGGGCVSVVDSPDNVVGGTNAAARNVLSGCGAGVEFAGALSTGNLVQGNYIGTNASGLAAISIQSGGGVGVEFRSDASNNTVGGTVAGAGNVISGNPFGGVLAVNTTSNNRIQGNLIGLGADGQTVVPNVGNGIELSGVTGYVIGGTTAAARNVISGNTQHGILISSRSDGIFSTGGSDNITIQGNFIGTNAAGDERRPNNLDGIRLSATFNVAPLSNVTVGGTAAGARNVISGNNQNGVNLVGNTTNNVVAGNYIGTNAAGTARLLNDGHGVRIEFSQNTVGGTTAAARNVISGNRSYGVAVEGGLSNAIQGNYIGTNAAGTGAIENGSGGVSDRGTGTLIGGLAATPGAPPGNLISGNQTAITIVFTASQTVIRGNLLGTEATGTAKLIDQSFGVFGSGTSTVVGGTEPGARNVISGFKEAVFGGGTIQGNYIGTDVSGTNAIPNREFGIHANDFAVIGGTTAAARNVISGNANGIWVVGSQASVQGNYIGANAAGAPLPNAGHGIVFAAGTHDNVVGGATAGAGNLIANNGRGGIVVPPQSTLGSGSPFNNSFRGNSVHSNGLLGIDLIAPPAQSRLIDSDGPTANDANDADTGPNGLQNYPVLTSVTNLGGSTSVGGTLNSKPGATYQIDFYANASCDPSGHGEGQTYLGSTQATTDSAGNANFNALFATPAGQVFTATATDGAGNTSEFSVCHEAGATGTVQFDSAAFPVNESTTSVNVTVTRTLGSAGAATVDYATSDGTAKAGEDYTPASGTLSFAAGETTKSFTVTILNDALDEDVETVNLTLSNPTGGISIGGYNTATISIADDDPPPVISSGDFAVFVAEGNSGTSEAVFNVKLSAPSGRAVTVNYNTVDGDATSGADYQPAMGTLTFAPGETSKTVSVLVNGDTAPEADESFALRLSGAVNANLAVLVPGPGSVLFISGVIWDDDSAGVHFSAPNYTVAERDGSVTIGVVRRGDASAPASVFYSASGDTQPLGPLASPRHDFTQALGRIDFAPGETQKSFTVLVNDDSYVEGPEGVILSIADVNATQPEQTLFARLTITSEDTGAPQPNPVDDTSFFVRQHYHDFLNREPDAPGLQFWTNEIEQCGADLQCREVKRINVSAAFFLSIEFQETGYLAYRTYKAAYGDTTSPGVAGTVPVIRLLEFLQDAQRIGRGVQVGVGNWEQVLEANKQAYALEFVGTQRFRDAFPQTLSADEFVTRLDQNAGGVLSAPEKAQLVATLGATPGDLAKRAAVLRAVADDTDLRRAELNRAFVLMEYFGYLRRNPDEAPDTSFVGWKFWLNKLNQFNGNYIEAEMVKAFITSIEYRQRFAQ